MTRSLHIAPAVVLALLAAPAGGQEALGFRDDFVGDRLGPEFRLLNPDPDRMAMVDGDYVLVVAHKDIKNAIAYLGTMPENFELTVRFASVPAYRFQGVGLLLGEGDNTLSAGLWIDPYLDPYMYFRKQLKGEESQIDVKINKEDRQPFYLRVRKVGVEYEAQFSFDGATWQTIGTHVSVRPYGRPTIRVYVSGGEAPETGIRIDSFEVVELR